MNNDNLKGLYETLKREGYEPPVYEQFEKDMQDEKNLQGAYQTLKNEGYEPPAYKTFRSDMGFGGDGSNGVNGDNGRSDAAVTQPQTQPVMGQKAQPVIGGKGEPQYSQEVYDRYDNQEVTRKGVNNIELKSLEDIAAEMEAEKAGSSKAGNGLVSRILGFFRKNGENGGTMGNMDSSAMPTEEQMRERGGTMGYMRPAQEPGKRTDEQVEYDPSKPLVEQEFMNRDNGFGEFAEKGLERLRKGQQATDPTLDEKGNPIDIPLYNQQAAMRGDIQRIDMDVMRKFNEELANNQQQAADYMGNTSGNPFAPTGVNLMVVGKEANKIADPSKAIEKAIKYADEQTKGMPDDVRYQVINNLLGQMEEQLVQARVPSGTAEYVFWRGFKDSDLGKIMSSVVDTNYEKYLDQVAQSRYNPGFWEKLGKGVVTLASDMWEYVLPGGAAGKAGKWAGGKITGRIANDLIRRGVPKAQATRIAERLTANIIGRSVLQHGASNAVTFGTAGAISGAVEGMTEPVTVPGMFGPESVEKTKIANDLGLYDEAHDQVEETIRQAEAEHYSAKNLFGKILERAAWGVGTGVATSFGGPLGEMLGHGRGVAGKILGDATRLGVNATAMTGVGALEQATTPGAQPLTFEDLVLSEANNLLTFGALEARGIYNRAKNYGKMQQFEKAYDITDADKARMKELGYGDMLDAVEQLSTGKTGGPQPAEKKPDIITRLVSGERVTKVKLPQTRESGNVDQIEPQNLKKGLQQLINDYNAGRISEEEARKWYGLITGDYSQELQPITGVSQRTDISPEGKEQHFVDYLDAKGRRVRTVETKTAEEARELSDEYQHEAQLNQISALEDMVTDKNVQEEFAETVNKEFLEDSRFTTRPTYDENGNVTNKALTVGGIKAKIDILNQLRGKKQLHEMGLGKKLTAEEEQMLEEGLTPYERDVANLFGREKQLQEALQKQAEGGDLLPYEESLIRSAQNIYKKMAGRNKAAENFARDFEKLNGMEEGSLLRILMKKERTEQEQQAVDEYVKALQDYLRPKPERTGSEEREPAADQQQEGETGGTENMGDMGETGYMTGPASDQPQPAEQGGDGANGVDGNNGSAGYERGKAAIVNGDGVEMRQIGHEVNVADARIGRLFSKEEAAAIYQAVESGDKEALAAVTEQQKEPAKRDAIMKLAEALDAAKGMDAAFDEQTAGIEGEVRAEAERYQSEDGRIVPLTLADGTTAFLMNGDPENAYGTVNVAYTDEAGQVQHKQIAARDITSIGEAEATDAYVARRSEELRKEQEGSFKNQIGGVDLRTGNIVELTMAGQTAPFRIDGFFDNGDLQLSDEGGEAMRMSRDEVIGMIRATEEKRVGEELDAEEKALKEAEKARKEAEKAEAERLKGVERDRRAQIEEIRGKVLKDSKDGKDFKDGDMEVMGEIGVMGDMGEVEKYLLEHFDSEVDADAFIRDQRLALRNYQRDEMQPKIDALQRDLDAYARSEREMTPEELSAVIQQHTQLMRQQEFLNGQAQKLKDASKRVGKTYSGKVGTEGLDATDSRSRRLSTLQKARSYEDKLKNARELYAGDAEASSLFDFESMEPKTIEEYAAEFLGAVPEQGKGIIDFESLQEETGHGGRRVGGDSRGYSAYLAPKGKGESIKALAHKMWERLPDQLHENWTDQDCRNALIEVLSSAQVPTDIRDYILNDRINQAEKYLRAQEEYEEEQQREEWAEAHHLQTSDREAYEASLDYIGEEYSLLTDDDIQKINAIFAEKYESRDEQDRRSQEMDRQPVAAGDGGEGAGGQGEIRPLSSEILHTEDQGRPDSDGQDLGKDKDAATAPVVSDSDVAGGAQGGVSPSPFLPRREGDFGPVYEQFRGKPKEAIAYLRQTKNGEAIGALNHKDVGDIDLVWGEEGSGKSDGYGLAKLVKYHSEVLDNLQEILDDMHVTKRSDNRVQLESDTHQAVVRLTWNDAQKNWLLTAFEKKNSALDNTTDTGETAKRGRQDDTATLQNTVSVGKDTENISDLQENEEKVAAKQQPAEKSASIQGIEGYDADEVLNAVRGDIEMKLEDAGIEGVSIKGMALHGSRMRGDAREDSDLDVVVEYEGDFSEDSLFNILNEVPTTIEGITVDINPITKGKSGTLEEYMERSRKYDEEVKDEGLKIKDERGKDFKERLMKAVQETNTEPTEGQKEAGNYKKGHLSFGGYNYTVENPKGSVRSGKDASGKPWSITMNNTYGYLTGKGHLGKDGDHLDVFINDDADLDTFGLDGDNGKIYIIDQVNTDGSFDEHKIMWGFNSEVDAIRNYLMNYSRPWHGLGNITGVDKATFDKWVESSDRKMKPFAETRFGDKRDVAAKVMDVVATKSQHTVKEIVKRWKDGELQEMEDGHISTLMRRLEGQKSMNDSLLERYKGKKREQLERNNAQIDADLAQLRGEQERRASWDMAGEPTQGYRGVVKEMVDSRNSKEAKEFPKRIQDWLNEENLSKARGKKLDEIVEMFGNDPQPVAFVPKDALSVLGDGITDNRIYSGMGYFINHAVNHHPSVSAEKYNLIQDVLSDPDDYKEIIRNGKRSVAFVKKIDRYNAVVVEVEKTPDGRIIWHKSFFDQKKEPYANYPSIRPKDLSSGGGVSPISHSDDSTLNVDKSVPGSSLPTPDDIISEDKVKEKIPNIQRKEHKNVIVSLKPETHRAGRWMEGDLFATAKPQPTEKDLFDTQESRNTLAKIVSMRPVEPRLDTHGLSSDYPQLQSFKKENPHALVAQGASNGDYVFRGNDAVTVENITHLDGGTVKGVRELRIPSQVVDRHLPMLVRHGKIVAVIDPNNPPTAKTGGRSKTLSINTDSGSDRLNQLLEGRKNRDADYLRSLIGMQESYISQLKNMIPSEERLYEEWQRAVGTKNEEKAQRAYEDYYAEHEETILAFDEARNQLNDLYEELSGKLTKAAGERQKRLSDMSDEDLLEGIGQNANSKDWDLYIDEYDKRHRKDYQDALTAYSDMLEKENVSLDDAYGMYADVSKRWNDGGFASDERSKLMAQVDALEEYVDRLESEAIEREEAEEEEAAAQQQPTEKRDRYEEDKTAVRAHGYDLTKLRLRDLGEGETSHVERRYVENGSFSFTGGERIESAADVAYIFRQLENSAVENSFMVLIKDGVPTVIHLAIGSYNGVMAPIEQAFVAYKEIDPDKVLFLHNHPSGSLKASREDLALQKKMEVIFGNKALPGIIIDTKSGKYAEFTGGSTSSYSSWEGKRPDSVEKDIPVRVFNFSKQVFSEDWNPETAFKAASSQSMAAFVSSHRLGDHKKLSLIVTDTAGHITGNVFLPWTSMEEIGKGKTALQIATYVQQMGGKCAFIYGNTPITDNRGIGALKTNLEGHNVYLRDVLTVEGSAYERGVLYEPEMEYKGSAKEMMEAVGKRYHGKEMVFLDKTHGEEQILKDLGLYDELSKWKDAPGYEDLMNDLRKNLEKTVASYNRDTKKIYIFAPDMTSSYAEEVFFHENIHAILDDWYGGGKRGIADRFWDVMPDDGKVSKTYVKEKSSDESEYAEEAFAYWLSRSMQDGDVSDFLNYFDDADKKRINNILKTLGYDTEEESGRRVRLRRNQHVSEAQSGYSEIHQGTGGKASGGTEEGLTDAASERSARDLATKAVMQVLGKSGVKYHEVSQEEAQAVLNNTQLLHDGRSFHVDTPVFVSNALKAVEGIKQEKATPEQWLKMIEKNGGLKAGEDKWMGLSDWLKGRPTPSIPEKGGGNKPATITKQEVLDFIRANQIQVEETNYKEYINVDDNPQMKEFREEFDDIVRKLEDEKAAVEQEANAFNDEMYQKYGEGWANDPNRLSKEDSKRNDEMIERWNKLNDEDLQELAFREMVEKYGDDFEMAFEYNYGNGKLEPQMDMYGDDISDAAKYFLQFEEQPINSTRLNYTTSGLENKKEIALTVPTVESWNESDEVHFGDAGEGRAVAWVRFGDTTIDAPATNLDKSLYTAKRSKNGGFDVFRPNGSEWGRIGAESAERAIEEAYNDDMLRNTTTQRVLVIDEIQSKRHQEGREKGYLPEHQRQIYELQAKIDAKEKEKKEYLEQLKQKYGTTRLLEKITNEEKQKFVEISFELDNLIRDKNAVSTVGLVPDAPFEKNWHELAMKRMLRYAAENGYDKVAWTKGEQQADRYNIGNVVDKVISYDYPAVADSDGRNTKKIEVRLKNGETMAMRVDQNGKVIEGRSDTEGKMLSDVVGKDLAKSIMSGEGKDGTMWDANRDLPAKIIEGDGLRIGGEGMKGFYDQMLPRFMDKYGKKWGVKTGEVKLPGIGGDEIASQETGLKMWAVDVTPEMKESVMQGQPMFSAGAKEPLVTSEGVVYGYTDGEDIYLTPEGINPETPAHEYGHLWVKTVKKNRPDLWENIKELMRVDEHSQKVYQKLLGDENYSQIHDNEDKLYEEVLTQMGGKKNRQRFEQAAREVIDEAPTAAEAVKVASVISRIRRAFRKLWDWIGKSLFQIKKFRSVDEVTDRMMYDFVEGNLAAAKPLPAEKEAAQPEFQVGKGKPRKMKGEGMAHYFGRLREWDQREKAKKDAAEDGIMEPSREQADAKAHADWACDHAEWEQNPDGKAEPMEWDYAQKAEKEYREALQAYEEKIDGYMPERTPELTKEDVIVEREMQVKTPAQKLMNDISEHLAREYDPYTARDAVKDAVIQRRKDIEEVSADDSIYIEGIRRETNRLADELMAKMGVEGARLKAVKLLQTMSDGKVKPQVTGADIRRALSYFIEAPMRRRDMANEANEALERLGYPARFTGDDIKRAEKELDAMRAEAQELLALHKEMAEDGRTEMTVEEQGLYGRVREGARKVADAMNGGGAAAEPQPTEKGGVAIQSPQEKTGPRIGADDIMATLSILTKRVKPEGLKVSEDMPELQPIIGRAKDWYAVAYGWLEDAGMRPDDIGYYKDYVNHVWDKERSDPEAYERYVANRQPTKSRNMRKREIRTLMDGEELGLVPKYDDIADLMGEYSKTNIQSWVNKKMLIDLSGIDVVERDESGEPTSMMSLLTSRTPGVFDMEKYDYFEIAGVGPVWVHKAASKNFGLVFETYEPGKLMGTYDQAASIAKNIELAWSGFHAAALTEVYVAQNVTRPKRATQNFYKYLIHDSLLQGQAPAYADPELYKDAARHLVKLGATGDYAPEAMKQVSGQLKDFFGELRMDMEEKGGLGKAAGMAVGIPEVVATAVKLLNEGMDKALWTWLHDGLKLCQYKMFREDVMAKAGKEGWSQDRINKALDEAGQYINDEFGGQHFEVIGVSPKTLRMMRRFLLSPDWLLSTQRHFLATFGFGSIYNKANVRNFRDFYRNVWHRGKGNEGQYDGRYSRAKASLACYALGCMIMYPLVMNALNALLRKKDEEYEAQMEQENPGYVSKYKLAYPEGMEGFAWDNLSLNPFNSFNIFGDYGMGSNAEGKKSHLFAGRYGDDTEMYIRWGKQFREFPELFETEQGELGFPGPLLKRLMGKSNPNIRFLYDTLNYYTRWDKSKSDEDLEAKWKVWIGDGKLQRNIGIPVGVGANKLWQNYLPFWVPTQSDKEWKPTDMILPSTKGFTPYKARNYFMEFIKAGDEDGIKETFKASVLNGMTSAQISRAFDAARKAVENESRELQLKDGNDIHSVTEAFDASQDLKERKELNSRIRKMLAADAEPPQDWNEFMTAVRAERDGTTEGVTKGNEKYLMVATSADVLEDARLAQLKKKASEMKRIHDGMKDNKADGRLLRQWEQQNQKWLDVLKTIKDGESGSESKQGILYWKKKMTGKETNDRKALEMLRKKRKSVLKAVGERVK